MVVVAQWQSTGGSNPGHLWLEPPVLCQRCPGFDSRRLPAFSLLLFSLYICSTHNMVNGDVNHDNMVISL